MASSARNTLCRRAHDRQSARTLLSPDITQSRVLISRSKAIHSFVLQHHHIGYRPPDSLGLRWAELAGCALRARPSLVFSYARSYPLLFRFLETLEQVSR